MNKKIISTIAVLSVIAVILPAVAIMGETPQGIYSMFSEANVTQEEVMDMSTLIVKGTIVNSHVEIAKLNGEQTQKTAFTVWTVETDRIYKGGDSDIVSFKTVGGKLSEGTYTVSTIDLQKGDQVIVMLVKDPTSIWGDNYHLVSIQQGAYKLEEGMAKSIESRNDKTEKDLESRILNHLS